MSAADDLAAYLTWVKHCGKTFDQAIYDEFIEEGEMSATDELRRLLDERGARWTACSKATIDNQTFCYGHTLTEFQGGLMVTDLTPEQAVEAMLGRGECRKLPSSGDTVCIVRRHGYEMEFGYWRCSECGCECFEGARYCMGCGRKVVDA